MTLFAEFLNNAALLLSLAMLYGLGRRFLLTDTLLTRVLIGVLFGGVAIVGMLVPVHLTPGVMFDGRSIVVGAAGFIGGPVTALVSAAMAATYRYQAGGAGTLTGIGTILSSAVLGALYREMARRNPVFSRALPLFVFAVVVHLVVLAWMLTLPDGLAHSVLSQISLPMMAIFPLTMLLFILLLKFIDRSFQNERDLVVSERRLRETQKASGLGMWEWDIRNDKLYWSDEVIRLWGYTTAEFSGDLEAVSSRIHPDDRDEWQRDVEACLKGDREHHIEMRICLPDGGIRWVEAFGNVERSAAGEPLMMRGMVRDIVSRKAAEAAKNASESRFRSIFDHAPLGVALVDGQGRAVLCNPTLGTMLGYSPAELGSKAFPEFTHPEDIAKDLEQYIGLQAGDIDSYRMEKRFLRHDGSVLWADLTVAAVRNKQDQTGYAVAMVSDITDRIASECEIRISEARLREAERIGHIGSWELAGDGKCAVWSEAILEILGTSPGTPVGPDYLSRLVDTRDWPAVQQSLHAALRTGAVHEMEYRIRRPDGEQRWVYCKGERITDDSGAALKLTGVLQDITVRKQAEAALRESERRYRAVFDQQFQFMTMLSPDGRVIEINSLALQAAQRQREDFIGRPIWETPPWDGLPEAQQVWRERLAEVSNDPGEVFRRNTYRTRDGDIRTADSVTKAIRNDDGDIEIILAQASDITERLRAEQERDRLLAELQALNTELDQKVRERTAELVAANRELQSFTYAVSHDLRAPTRAISGFQAALIEDYGDQLPAGAHEFLHEIETGAERMNLLIEGLLKLSRSSRGEVERTAIDLAVVAQELYQQLRATDPGREVTLRLQDDLGVRGDPRLLRTLLQNLLENAWKYTARTARATITINRVDLDGQVYICIEDNGAGFDPGFADKLFEPFQRLHRQDEFPGIGIGLATAARIVYRHGGDIAGCGRSGVGARFCFTLGPG